MVFGAVKVISVVAAGTSIPAGNTCVNCIFTF